MNAEDVVQQLRKSFYSEREWAFLPQVADSTGSGYGRTADAIALNCWPSRGMELHGFEIKTYRGDFKREMEKPEKAEAVAQYCDRWFLVVPESLKITPDDLPPTWGLFVMGEKPALAKPAAKLDAKPLTRAFIASVLRAAQKEGGIPTSEHQRLLNAKHVESFAAGRRYASTTRDDDRVRWQIDALTSLERNAKNVLASIQRDLKEVRRMEAEPPLEEPAVEQA